MGVWVLLGCAIVAEVFATSSLKASEGFTRPLPTFAVVVGYGLAFWLLSMTLGKIPLGVAYAVWSGLGIVLIAASGRVLYGDRLDLPAMLGMGLILSGVVVINMFSKSVPH